MARVMSTSSSALVLFSGGQDSTTCLASALKRYRHVETIGFDYGQRHRVELDAREDVLAAIRQNFPQWAERLGEDHLEEHPVFPGPSHYMKTSKRLLVLFFSCPFILSYQLRDYSQLSKNTKDN